MRELREALWSLWCGFCGDCDKLVLECQNELCASVNCATCDDIEGAVRWCEECEGSFCFDCRQVKQQLPEGQAFCRGCDAILEGKNYESVSDSGGSHSL